MTLNKFYMNYFLQRDWEYSENEIMRLSFLKLKLKDINDHF